MSDLAGNSEDKFSHLGLVSQAVASRRQLLSRCLLTVPHHPDHQDGETLIDDRYRLPWKKGRLGDITKIHAAGHV